MKRVETTIDIDADPDAVWAVLADRDAYPRWNLFITRMAGDLEPETTWLQTA